ncbi:MAG: transcriptional regulator [Sandaracinus sp.]|nr:transcriptional regulator [Sandaracinus sp.]
MKTVVIGFLGTTLDAGLGDRRWNKWRPTVALGQHEDLVVDRLELVHPPNRRRLAETVAADVRQVSPETEVRLHALDLQDPWDFEEVFAGLHGFARSLTFDEERERYLVHITTGTHVAQICFFLLTESRHFPATLLQTSPPKRSSTDAAGSFALIDLDRSRYDALARRFAEEREESLAFLKAGIATRSPRYNALVENLERVVLRSGEPVLLLGPTGAGKSQLARRIDALLRSRRRVKGPLVEVNCATLRGDGAMSALFGHVKGAFTGAATARAGLLRAADGGVLFLDEVGELGLDEQAMLLRAIEDGRFLPVGSDRETASDFRLICGTNRDLRAAVAAGEFREDLLARIDLWTFALPGLRERREDHEPNLDHELERVTGDLGLRVTMNREARAAFLAFAAAAPWPANFRDFHAAILRMGTLAPGGRIDTATVADEIARLERGWRAVAASDGLEAVLDPEALAALDPFDRPQLAEVVRVCRRAPSLSAAGRELFAVSRTKRKSTNDADRLRKYLARHDLDFTDLG